MKRIVFIYFITLFICSPIVSAQKKWPAYRLRGINTILISDKFRFPTDSNSYINENYFRLFRKWHVNVLRVLLTIDPSFQKDSIYTSVPKVNDTEDIYYYKDNLKILEKTLNLAKKYNILIVIYTNRLRGYKSPVFYNPRKHEGYYYEILRLYSYIARNFGSNDNLIAYDPLSEPNPTTQEYLWRKSLFKKFVDKIRNIDKETYIFFAPGPNGLVKGYRDIKPYKLRRIIYTFHYYYPHEYTHQGILRIVKAKKGEFHYPGKIKDIYNSPYELWNKQKLEEVLQPILAFRSEYEVNFIVGEFSAVRWAPNASNWLNDLISVFEKYGLDWCYFSFGGWNGWNPTVLADMKEALYNYNKNTIHETDRLRVLRNYWNLNKK